ncbi:MAG: hypothetical protein EOP05_08905 [Proteobacteria bacterium]|nr:MAG: hypothetical protein EOP05_08905 [Pseudomonadota bacterium]
MVRFLQILIFFASFTVSIKFAKADWMEPVFRYTHETLNRKTCPQANTQELRLFAGPQCGHSAVAQLIQHTKAAESRIIADSNIVTEEFFNHGAAKQLNSYKCQLNKYGQMTNGSTTSDTAIESTANDLNKKLPLLRTLKAEIETYQKKLKAAEAKRDTSNVYSGAAFGIQIRNELIETEAHLTKLKTFFAATMLTNPLGHFVEGGKLIERLIAAPPNMVVLPKGVKAAYEAEKLLVARQFMRFDQLQTSAGKFSLARSDREYLYRHGSPETWVDARTSKSAAYAGLICRMEGGYGAGVQEFQDVALAASMVMWGGGLLILRGAQGLKAATAALGMSEAAVPAVGRFAILANNIPYYAFAIKRVQTNCHGFDTKNSQYSETCQIPPEKEMTVLLEQNCRYAQSMLVANGIFAAIMTAPVKAAALTLASKIPKPKAN